MNTFGNMFRISVFGESHAEKIGVTLDGMPAGIDIDIDELYRQIDRRKTGKPGTSKRLETDVPNIICGVMNGTTTGSPITILFDNSDTRSKDYSFVRATPRPGQADFTAQTKFYGYNDFRGGGAFSGRLTLPLVAAGYFAKLILSDVKISAKIISLHGQENYSDALNQAISKGDSIGGIIECRICNLPGGIGEQFFGSIEANIAHLAFSVPGIIGIEFGAGFAGTKLFGSEYNDAIYDKNGKTKTNNSGGINGGISNGNDIVFRVAAKPTPSISKPQEAFNFDTGELSNLAIQGRHDACFALRLPVIIESVAAIALADLALIRFSQIYIHKIKNNL